MPSLAPFGQAVSEEKIFLTLANLQVVYYKCVKFHKNPISRLGGVAFTRYMVGQTDGQGDSYIPPQTLFVGGIMICKSE